MASHNDDAEKHLSQADAVMAKLIAAHPPYPAAEREYQPFQALVTAIISQQLSFKAAATIKNRVLDIVPSFTPEGFLAVTPEALRGAGLSGAKVRYILELAARASDGRIDFDVLLKQSDAEAMATLVALPGIGKWTAEMFLMFSLNRPDILSLGDVALQRAARLLYGEGVSLEQIGQAWSPYRSVASWYLWRHAEVKPTA
jgi:DNA-3-methyladenine glycosylase II